MIVSLLSFTSCTTLTAAEHCALAGQALEGMIASPHHPLATTNRKTYGLPVCKVAKTEEEKAMVADLMPTAQEKNTKRKIELWTYYGGLTLLSLTFLLFLPWGDLEGD